jgi:cytidyltransferase-like protein
MLEKNTPHTRVMAFGTFDLFHPGHKHYLDTALALGDELIVIVARDSRVLTVKLRSPIHTELTRLDNVSNACPEAMVIL